ncbi:MAG: HAD-IC family P-type ATPase [Pleurocapsa minor GSE-CHR-MK-17-07R]|jgi:cation-transporting ATPase E|nr:HAD-IC family P-type ATPase [Pleurocapsa minor GSE-CHR-MK 17-07R]
MTTSLTQGLTEAEVIARRQRGLGNNVEAATSRKLSDIIRQNVLTLINIILFTLGVMLVALGYVGDAVVSVGLIFFNSTIGIIQEIRAKRQLDKIALLTRPRVSVMREGIEKIVDPSEIVVGDILVAHAGDQIVADGVVVGEGRIDMDESLLTGESDHIPKKQSDEVLSGSFVVSGSALVEATKVGASSFANKLTNSARAYRNPRTPLQKDVDLVFRLLLGLAIFIGLLMFISGFLQAIPLARGVRMATVIAGIVPNGLFLMVIVAYALGALRIVQRGALIQQQNSVESLSNVTVLCMDKTGTLTANKIAYHDVMPLEGRSRAEIERTLGIFASSASARNRTSEAIAAALSLPPVRPADEVPFSSALKWSALAFHPSGDLDGVYVLGAMEMLAAQLPDISALDAQTGSWAQDGLRVLVFAHAPGVYALHDALDQPVLPEKLTPIALIALSDELRAEAADTIAAFAKSGIRLKVISGDNPHTVAALARRAGLPGDLTVISGIDLASMSDSDLDVVVEETTVFGRITPDQKERLVDALRRRGHYVAMMGDGVNDVLSLKKANLGIAMQSGSAATRGVADMVLLNDSFAALPPAFLEGQRIVAGMRDILSLFLTRAIFTAIMILSVAVIGIGFPFVPKHTTLLTFFAVGIPVLFLAIWARPVQARTRLLKSITHFVSGGAVFVALFGLLTYVGFFAYGAAQALEIPYTPENVALFRDQMNLDTPVTGPDVFIFEYATATARTALTIFSVLTGLLLVIFVEPPYQFFVGGDELSPDKRPMILAFAITAGFFGILLIEPLRDFFEMLPMPLVSYVIIIGWVVLWMFTVRQAWRKRWVERFLNISFS